MQEARYDESAIAALEELQREARLAKIHHEHLGNGQVLGRQYYTGKTDEEIVAQMDAEARLIEAAGGEVVRRAKVGRNQPCPCGSGAKFKKCCINGARAV